MREAIGRFEALGMVSMLTWVLKANPYRAFYESLGGIIIDQKTIENLGITMDLVAYGWDDIRTIRLSAR